MSALDQMLQELRSGIQIDGPGRAQQPAIQPVQQPGAGTVSPGFQALLQTSQRASVQQQPAAQPVPELEGPPLPPKQQSLEELGGLVDEETGGGLLNRALVGGKLSKKGGASALVETYGAENVRVHPERGVYLKEWNDVSDEKLAELRAKGLPEEDIKEQKGQYPKVRRFTRQDLPGFWDDPGGELAALTGDLVEMGLSFAIPGAGAALGGAVAGPAGAAVGLAGGKAIADPVANIARQGFSALLPGDDELTAGERATMVGVSAVAPKVTGAVTSRLFKALENARPTKKLRDAVMSGIDQEVVERGLELGKAMDLPLDLAQLARDEGITALRTAAQQGIGGNKITANLKFQLDRFASKLDKRLAKVSGDKGLADVGIQVAKSTKAHLDKLGEARSIGLRGEFAKAHILTGGRRVVPLKNLVKEHLEQAEEFGFSVDVGSASLVGKKAGEGFDQYIELATRLAKADGKNPATMADDELLEYAKVSVKEASRLLTAFGRGSQGKGKAILGLEDVGLNSAVSARRLEALNADLDEFAGRGGSGAEAIAHIREGRRIWGAISDEMNAVRASVLGKALEMDKLNTPDKFVKKLMTDWSPAQSKAGMAILDAIDPASRSDIRKAAVQHVINRAHTGADLSIRKLSSTPLDVRAKLSGILSGDKQLAKDWDLFVEYADRMTHGIRAVEGSPTSKLTIANKILDNITKFGVKGGALMAARSIMTNAFVSEAFVNTKTRDALLALMRDPASAGKGLRRAEVAMKYLSRLGILQTRTDISTGLTPDLGPTGFSSQAPQDPSELRVQP